MKRVNSSTKLLQTLTSPFDIECLLNDIVDILWLSAGKPKFFYRKVMNCPQHISNDDLNQMEYIRSKLPDVDALRRCQQNFRWCNVMGTENSRREARLINMINQIEIVDKFFKELISRIQTAINENQKKGPQKSVIQAPLNRGQ